MGPVYEVILALVRNVRFGSKADMMPLNFDVRFTPESGHSLTRLERLLWAHKRTHALAAKSILFDHLVGERDELHKRLYFDLHQCRGSQT